MFSKNTGAAFVLSIVLSSVLLGEETFSFTSRSSIVRDSLTSRVAIERTSVPLRNSIMKDSDVAPLANTIRATSKKRLLPPPALASQKSNLLKEGLRRSVTRISPRQTADFIVTSGDSITLPQYVSLVVSKNKNFTSGDYEADLSRLEGLISQSRYDLTLAFQGLVAASQLPTPTEGMGTTFTGRMGIQANKLLYDGGRHYVMNEHTTLIERFSKFRRLSAKDQATLYGAELYFHLLELQERKHYIKQYQDVTDQLYQNTVHKVERGVSDNVYELINVKMDKLGIEKLALGLDYDLHNALLAFKQAAYLSSTQDFSLAWPNISAPDASVEELQRRAIEKSAQIEMADVQFRLKKGDVLAEQSQNDWRVDLNAFGGVGYSNTITNITNSNSQGINWLVTLQAVHPLNPAHTDLAVERKTVEALNEKNNLAVARQNMALRISRLFSDTEREDQFLNLLLMQKELAERHLKIVKYRYEGGLEPYLAYAASVKKNIEIDEDILASKTRRARNAFEMQILTRGLD
ncbi:MAG: TolC family protein [Sulfuricurvum sp.]|nr:TolC family protein [Sulfuricurvum sp.]